MKRQVTATFKTFINGVEQRKIITQYANQFMNPVWDKFNKNACQRGFYKIVEGSQYLGNMAWENAQGQVMELRKVA